MPRQAMRRIGSSAADWWGRLNDPAVDLRGQPIDGVDLTHEMGVAGARRAAGMVGARVAPHLRDFGTAISRRLPGSSGRGAATVQRAPIAPSRHGRPLQTPAGTRTARGWQQAGRGRKAAVAGTGAAAAGVAGMNAASRMRGGQEPGQRSTGPTPTDRVSAQSQPRGPRSFEQVVGRGPTAGRAGAPARAANPFAGQGDPFTGAARNMERMWNATSYIDQRYQQQINQLREMYEFAETAEERAQLQFILGDIEGQRSAAHTIIGNVYGDAIEQTADRASGMRDQASADAADVQGFYEDAAQSTRANIGEVAESHAGSGLGVEGTAVSGDAGDWVALLDAAAPREAAAAQTIGNIGADDVAHLAETMRAERPAHQGELERVAMQLAAQAQMEHDRRVQERVHAERMAFAAQAGQLGQAGIEARLGTASNLFNAGEGARLSALDAQLGINQQHAQALNQQRMSNLDFDRQRQLSHEDARREWELGREMMGSQPDQGDGQMQWPASDAGWWDFMLDLAPMQQQQVIESGAPVPRHIAEQILLALEGG